MRDSFSPEGINQKIGNKGLEHPKAEAVVEAGKLNEEELKELLPQYDEVQKLDEKILDAEAADRKDFEDRFKRKFGYDYYEDLIEDLLLLKQRLEREKQRQDDVENKDKNRLVRALAKSQNQKPLPTAKDFSAAASPEQFELAKKVFAKKSEQELEGETIKETNENFIQAARAAMAEFAVHGVLRMDKNGEQKLEKFTDLDGKASVYLLKRAGFNLKNLQYVAPGTSLPGYTNIDTGSESGVSYRAEDDTAFIDHHDPEKDALSASALVYQTLTKLNLLPKDSETKKSLSQLVDFVNYQDNKNYPEQEKYFKDYDKNILGLARFMTADKLGQFFADGHTPTENLSREDLIKYGLVYKKNKDQVVDRPAEQKKMIAESLQALDEMEKNGQIFNSAKYGKIAVDRGNKVKGGADAAYAYGCSVYLKWNDNGFFLSSKQPLEFELSEGQKVRGTMYMKAQNVEPLQMSLDEVLGKLEVAGYASPENQKKAI